jgi:uncharacterized protein (DUF1778 family)
MEKKFNATAYKNKFIAEKYERINLNVPKGQKDIIKAHADKFDNGSINGFIKRAISETIQRDLEKQ